MDLRSLLDDYSVVIVRDNKVLFQSKDPGITPLIQAIESIELREL